MVAQDVVNQTAAVVVTSVGAARELGIPESKWVYLKGYADVDDHMVLKRPNLAQSNAQNLAVRHALQAAGVAIANVNYLDFYSCFPIAVSSITEPLGLPTDGSRALTLTGGLLFFSGPGNNCSMHAIATIIEKLRADRNANGLVVANGGYLSKHSAAVYSCSAPGAWQPTSSSTQQAQAKADTGIVVDEQAQGGARASKALPRSSAEARRPTASSSPGWKLPTRVAWRAWQKVITRRLACCSRKGSSVARARFVWSAICINLRWRPKLKKKANSTCLSTNNTFATVVIASAARQSSDETGAALDCHVAFGSSQ